MFIRMVVSMCYGSTRANRNGSQQRGVVEEVEPELDRPIVRYLYSGLEGKFRQLGQRGSKEKVVVVVDEELRNS